MKIFERLARDTDPTIWEGADYVDVYFQHTGGKDSGSLNPWGWGTDAPFAADAGIIRERTVAGLQAAKARGRVGGRPPALTDDDLVAAKAIGAASCRFRQAGQLW